MLGTPDYMAPEQILDARRADIRADIYSVGCTLYYLLAAQPPFQTNSLYETLEAHHSREPTPLNLLRPDVPLELAALVAKMMAKDPARRFQTPAEAAQALVPFTKPRQSLAPSLTAAEAEREPSPAPPPFPVQVEAHSAALVPLPLPLRAIPIAQPARENALASVEAQARFGDVTLRYRRRPKRRRLRSLAIGFALAGAMLLAGVVFRFKTSEGVVAVEANVDQPKVSVERDRASIAFNGDQKAEASVKPGTGQMQIEKDGVTAAGAEVSLANNGRQLVKASFPSLLTASLESDTPQSIAMASSLRSHPSRGSSLGSIGGNRSRKTLIANVSALSPLRCAAPVKTASRSEGIWMTMLQFPRGLFP